MCRLSHDGSLVIWMVELGYEAIEFLRREVPRDNYMPLIRLRHVTAEILQNGKFRWSVHVKIRIVLMIIML